MLCLACCGCATTPRDPWVLDTAGVSARGTELSRIGTYEQALATTLAIMSRDLGLPRVEARLAFLPDDPTFERFLREIGYPPALARDTAEVMTAIGGHRMVLINQRRMERDGWPRRVSLLAHELTHVLQYEVGGGQRGTSAQWLREGFAEWVSLRVMETLGQIDGGLVRRHALQRVRSFGGPAAVPQLADLGAFRAWVAQSRTPAGEILYDLALVAVMELVDAHGATAVVRYFSLFERRQDRAANFREAFGISEPDFAEDVTRRIWPSRRKQAPSPPS